MAMLIKTFFFFIKYVYYSKGFREKYKALFFTKAKPKLWSKTNKRLASV